MTLFYCPTDPLTNSQIITVYSVDHSRQFRAYFSRNFIAQSYIVTKGRSFNQIASRVGERGQKLSHFRWLHQPTARLLTGLRGKNGGRLVFTAVKDLRAAQVKATARRWQAQVGRRAGDELGQVWVV